MQYLIQYRQSQLLKISTIVVLAVLMLNRSVSFALFLLVGLVLQWLFNVRRAWGLYTPIVTGCLLVLLPRTDALDNYTVLPILLLVLVLASLKGAYTSGAAFKPINLPNRLINPVKPNN